MDVDEEFPLTQPSEARNRPNLDYIKIESDDDDAEVPIRNAARWNKLDSYHAPPTPASAPVSQFSFFLCSSQKKEA